MRCTLTIEGYNAALILGADKTGIFAKSLEDMANNSGATNKAFEAMAQNYEVALQRMGNAAEVAMIKAGKPLLDEFGGVANGIAAVFKSLGQSIDAGAFDPIIQPLEVFGQSMAGTLQQIAQNLPEALSGLDFSDLIRSFDHLGDEVGDAFAQIFGNIDLSTPGGLRDALQMIVDGVAALTNVTAGIVDGLEPVFAALGGLARSADSAGEDAQIAVGQFLAAAELIVTFGTKLGGALIALQEYGNSFESIFDVVIGTIRTAFNAFQIAVDGVAATFWEIMRELASGLATVLPDSMGGSDWKAQVEGIDALLNGFAQRQQVNFDDLTAGFTQAGQGLGLVADEASATADALNETGGGFGGVAEAAEKAGDSLYYTGGGFGASPMPPSRSARRLNRPFLRSLNSMTKFRARTGPARRSKHRAIRRSSTNSVMSPASRSGMKPKRSPPRSRNPRRKWKTRPRRLSSMTSSSRKLNQRSGLPTSKPNSRSMKRKSKPMPNGWRRPSKASIPPSVPPAKP